MPLVTFIDANGRQKTARSIKVIKHSIRDAINNTTFDEPWVEIQVVGRVRGEWTEYIPLKEFIRSNPELAYQLGWLGER